MTSSARGHVEFAVIVLAIAGAGVAVAHLPLLGIGGTAVPVEVRTGVQLGALLAALLAGLSYASLIRALTRSHLLFMSVFYGGFICRVVFIFACALVISRFDGLSLPAALITLVSAYFLMSLAEMVCLVRQTRDTTAGDQDS